MTKFEVSAVEGFLDAILAFLKNDICRLPSSRSELIHGFFFKFVLDSYMISLAYGYQGKSIRVQSVKPWWSAQVS